MTLRLGFQSQVKSWVKQLIRPYSTNTINPNAQRVIDSSSREDPIAEHYQRTKVGDYNVNYLKVGHGPHAVFCYPGILGELKI